MNKRIRQVVVRRGIMMCAWKSSMILEKQVWGYIRLHRT
jgi:hypothetical protein